jgi:hypothetical protein
VGNLLTGRRWLPTPLLVLLAELSALAATLDLFFVPAFEKYQGIIFPDSKPPGFETGWHHFGFWQPIPSSQSDLFVMYLMIAPPVIIAIAALSLFIGQSNIRVTLLWTLFLIMAITVAPRIFDFGYFFIPATVFLLGAALVETRWITLNFRRNLFRE